MPPVTLQLVEETKQMANEDFKNGNYSLAGGNYRFAMLILEHLGEWPGLLLPRLLLSLTPTGIARIFWNSAKPDEYMESEWKESLVLIFVVRAHDRCQSLEHSSDSP